jgi:hypothetical protein
MSELSPEAKRLLESARESYSPAPARVDAVREALAARIATLGSQGAASSAASALSVGAVAPKLVALGLIAAAGTGALWFATRDAAPPPAPAGVSASPSARAAPAPAVDAIAARPVTPRTPAQDDHAQVTTAPPPRVSANTSACADVRPNAERDANASTPVRAGPSAAARGEHTPRARPPVAGSTKRTPSRASTDPTASAPPAPRRTQLPDAPSSKPLAAVPEAPDLEPDDPLPTAEDEPASAEVNDSLASELALLRRARTALDRRDPQAALLLAKQHAVLYPRGTLRQERLATQILALCGLQRPEEARVLVRELERVAPRSPHLMRIRTSCVRQEESDEVR